MKKYIAIFLIATLMFNVMTPVKKADAVVPVALVPIAALVLIAAGVSFSTSNDANNTVNDWLSQAGDNIVANLNNDMNNAYNGIMGISDDVWQNARKWIKDNISEGDNTATYNTKYETLNTDEVLEVDNTAKVWASDGMYTMDVTSTGTSWKLYRDGVVVCSASNSSYNIISSIVMSSGGSLKYGIKYYWNGVGPYNAYPYSSVSSSNDFVEIPGITYHVTGQPGVKEQQWDWDIAQDGTGTDYFWFTPDGILITSPIPPGNGKDPKRLIEIGFPVPGPGSNIPTLEDAITKTPEQIKIGDGELLDHSPNPFEEPLPNPQPQPNPNDYTTTTTTTTTTTQNPDGTETSDSTGRTTLPDAVTDILTDTKLNPDSGQREKTELNWEPLKRVGSDFTWKFPFSLPWDILRGFQSLNDSAGGFTPKFTIDLSGTMLKRNIVIDLTMWSGIAEKVRVVELFLFDLGLVLITRRLMGGDV